MGRKRRKKENFRDEGMAGIAIIAVILYAIYTAIFWLIVIGIAILILFIAYQLSLLTKDNLLKIFIGFISIILISFGGTEILRNYGKINKSILDYSIETAQELRLKTSNKGNIKIESDYGTLIETKN